MVQARQLLDVHLPFSNSKERKTLDVALHHGKISIPTWLPTGHKLTCASVKWALVWRSIAEECLISVS